MVEKPTHMCGYPTIARRTGRGPPYSPRSRRRPCVAAVGNQPARCGISFVVAMPEPLHLAPEYRKENATPSRIMGVVCPSCRTQTRVLESRRAPDGDSVRRRRECPECGRRFTTFERREPEPADVIKRDGERQRFDRTKLRAALLKAGHKRPITAADMEPTVDRRYTAPGVHPFDEVEWEVRDAIIGDPETPAFEQRGVEFPKSWSQNAANIVAQKYFRGRIGSPERESSVKQMISRVAGTIAGWGRELDYFATAEDADAFEAELTHILLHQEAAFNSPVWFNVGFEEHPQCSACFILSVQDTMESILDWNTKEGMIFRGGSGSGINLSTIRSSKEHLSKGGLASGPVSFMRGADAWAGTIKSGGKTRRAAKMVVLDVDHPDIRDFIWCKAKEEEKAAALRD